MNLKDLLEGSGGLTEANRPIRLRLSQAQRVLDDVLLVKRVIGSETLCGGLEYRLLCVSTRADIPLKEFIALPVELQFVTDRGDVRAICGIVAQAAAYQSSYKDLRAVAATLYSIVRIAQNAKWKNGKE